MKRDKKDCKIGFRLPSDQYNKIQELSEDKEVSIATIVRWAIKDYLKD